MKILALDACSEGCSVALACGSSLFEQRHNEPRSHAKAMLPLVDTVLQHAQCELSDIDLLAVTHGPGSFTGIRIALGFAQGLAYSASLPVVALASLEVMAYQFLRECAPSSLRVGDHIVCVLDARMSELYWAVYERDDTGVIERIAPSLTSVAEFLHVLTDSVELTTTAEVWGCGSGWLALQRALSVETKDAVDSTAWPLCGDPLVSVEPSATAVLAALDAKVIRLTGNSNILKSERQQQLQTLAVAAEQLQPLYLRNEVAWKKRQRIREGAL